jgi:hypothetical protein
MILRRYAYGARMLSMAPGTRNELEPRALPIAPEATTIWRDFHDHVENAAPMVRRDTVTSRDMSRVTGVAHVREESVT